jgi:hypothetical protein
MAMAPSYHLARWNDDPGLMPAWTLGRRGAQEKVLWAKLAGASGAIGWHGRSMPMSRLVRSDLLPQTVSQPKVRRQCDHVVYP